MKQEYKFLKDINFPSDLKKVSENDLQELSDEVRKEMINAVSETIKYIMCFKKNYFI